VTCSHDFHWFPDFATEAGWKCVKCSHRPGEPDGFSPLHDRELLDRKVFALLNDLCNQNLIYISNGTDGEGIELSVAARCRTDGRYDQGSILLFILEAKVPGHAKYWKEISDGVIRGSDPRRRCHCGKLSTSSTLVSGEWIGRCSKHWNDPIPEARP
jgi:hypothetical protein